MIMFVVGIRIWIFDPCWRKRCGSNIFIGNQMGEIDIDWWPTRFSALLVSFQMQSLQCLILNSWWYVFRWCVFWDLYCAAPERREQNEHSSEAKAFHDYSANVHQNNAQTPMHPTDPQHANPQFNPYFQVSR